MLKLIFLPLFSALISAQSVNVNSVRLNPAVLPATCVTGELRIDSADSNKLNLCRGGSFVDIMDALIWTNPMTTNGDLVVQAAGVPSRLAIGSANTVLKSNGTAPSWGQIVNADIDAAAAIADSKLATISTASKVSNSATTAASANTASAIVARDTNGDFTAGVITAALTGNASTATALAANPSDCGADTYATTIAASGNLTCSTVTSAGLAGSIAVNKIVAQTVSRALVTDASGFMAPATTTSTEIGYVNGVTSAIQTQINTKAPTASPTFTGTVTGPFTTAGPVITTSGGVLSSEAALAIARGGTNNASLGVTSGGVVVMDGSKATTTAAGTTAQYFKGGTPPTWSSFTQPTIQTFTSGSGTYTTPANVVKIEVLMVGSGASGTGAGSASASSNGVAGDNSTFGSSLLTANGGSAVNWSSAVGGTGGGFTVSAPALDIGSAYGDSGGGSVFQSGASDGFPGGQGGSTCLGGGGKAGHAGTGENAQTNSGAGGAGGGTNGASEYSGGGGGGAGCVRAIINAPSASYAYAVGAGKTGGAAGTSGFAGGNSAAGKIIVIEYYQ